MHSGAQDPEKLNPRKLLGYFTRILRERKDLVDEVVIRRIISAVYFALFNYWSMKSLLKGLRGRGPSKDSFWFSEFHQHLLEKGLDYAVYTIYVHRVAVDHYTLNPTRVVLTSQPWKGEEVEVEIGGTTLERVLESAYDILECLEKY